MISVKSKVLFKSPHQITYSRVLYMLELVPSSARSAAPAASPLPEQLVPLLQEALDQMRSVIDKALPVSKKRTALEEAEWEDEGEEGALERELMLQCGCQ